MLLAPTKMAAGQVTLAYRHDTSPEERLTGGGSFDLLPTRDPRGRLTG